MKVGGGVHPHQARALLNFIQLCDGGAAIQSFVFNFTGVDFMGNVTKGVVPILRVETDAYSVPDDLRARHYYVYIDLLPRTYYTFTLFARNGAGLESNLSDSTPSFLPCMFYYFFFIFIYLHTLLSL